MFDSPPNAALSRPVLGGRVNFPVCLAPMVGLTHRPFREIVRSYLPKGAVTIWPTEMLNSRRLPYERFQVIPETLKGVGETEMVPQILGNEEKFISESVRRLEGEWGAEGIDINMGCPVRKALQHNYGVSLMGDPHYAEEVVAMTVRNTTLPVSVKLRAGNEKVDPEFLKNFAQGLENAGASWITLHPRLAVEGRRGTAQWETIGWLREQVKIPVIGNGDVQTAQDVVTMTKQTKCDLVMIGRAMTARPWILWQVGAALGFSNPEGRQGPAPQTPEEESQEYGRMLLGLLEKMQGAFAEPLGVRRFRFFVRTGCVWLDFGNTLLAELHKAETYQELQEALVQFFSVSHRMHSKSALRN